MIAAICAASTFAQAGAADAASRHHGRHGHEFYAQAHAIRHKHQRRFASGGTRHWTSAGSPARASTVASSGSVQVGRASFYAGGRTASGAVVGSATCAHRSLPFGTRVLVTNLANARQAVLTVNDRGPFVRGRVLDVSRGAAGILGMLHAGVSQIRLQVLGGAG